MQPIRWRNLVGILAVAFALTAYSKWAESIRRSDSNRSADSSEVVGLPLLRQEEAYSLWQDELTVFLDVRSVGEYEVGHIAKAINLPEEDFERQFPDLKPRLEHARAIVVYCKSRDCAKSLWTAIRLRQQGLRQTSIYPNGWNEWFNNGLPKSVREQ